jgi:hypothetical protein
MGQKRADLQGPGALKVSRYVSLQWDAMGRYGLGVPGDRRLNCPAMSRNEARVPLQARAGKHGRFSAIVARYRYGSFCR